MPWRVGSRKERINEESLNESIILVGRLKKNKITEEQLQLYFFQFCFSNWFKVRRKGKEEEKWKKLKVSNWEQIKVKHVRQNVSSIRCVVAIHRVSLIHSTLEEKETLFFCITSQIHESPEDNSIVPSWLERSKARNNKNWGYKNRFVNFSSCPSVRRNNLGVTGIS